jgi:Cd2+/Zn2+-exporting ATPase
MSDDCKHCGCDSRPGHDETPRESVLNPDAKASAQTTLRVAGMDCADEVEAIQRALKPLAGVREVRVNLMGVEISSKPSLARD